MPRPDLTGMLVSNGVVASRSSIGRGMVWTVLERAEDGTIGKYVYRQGVSANMDAFIADVLAVLAERDGMEDAA